MCQIMKWVEFASNFPTELEACHATLKGLNEELTRMSVLLGSGLQPSEADVIVFSAIHSFVVCSVYLHLQMDREHGFDISCFFFVEI